MSGNAQNVQLGNADPRELLSSAKLAELLKEVAPGETLEPEVEEFLREHAEEFVESVTEYACQLAKHRNSKTLEARDIQYHLEKNWNIRVPGYGDDPKPLKRNPPNPVHLQRMQQVQKAQQQQQQQSHHQNPS
eukprot:CAMPEP_0184692474 /NCGR_PEP_ID=MMETSP0313-20130426/943_1 /TAXON_ID=2792 /ORGANISM="Porphyridium aerugineum, Strain SAG 1380-2" /LENGTH=132 /DNA_ID=CAMNT_0027150309 /DNA_START=254 /DNA_END=652 /DNA_ORIENTATION=+